MLNGRGDDQLPGADEVARSDDAMPVDLAVILGAPAGESSPGW
jgi:hypothetical protein